MHLLYTPFYIDNNYVHDLPKYMQLCVAKGMVILTIIYKRQYVYQAAFTVKVLFFHWLVSLSG